MAIYADIFIDQGATYITEIVIADVVRGNISLDGATVYGQIRKYYGASMAVDFLCEIIDTEAGIVRLTLTSDQTRVMRAGRYVYDIFIEDADDKTTRVLEGQVDVTPAVSQP